MKNCKLSKGKYPVDQVYTFHFFPEKMLNEVFAVASLPEDGWKLFNSICGKYEKGGLKKATSSSKRLEGKANL
jgi:hypothetical protein